MPSFYLTVLLSFSIFLSLLVPFVFHFTSFFTVSIERLHGDYDISFVAKNLSLPDYDVSKNLSLPVFSRFGTSVGVAPSPSPTAIPNVFLVESPFPSPTTSHTRFIVPYESNTKSSVGRYVQEAFFSFLPTLLQCVQVFLILVVLGYNIYVFVEHHINHTVVREQLLIAVIVIYPSVFAYISFRCLTLAGLRMTLYDGGKEMYGNIVAGAMYCYLVVIAERTYSYVHRERLLMNLPSFFFFKANERSFRLKVLVWQAAVVRLCGTVLKLFLQLVGLDHFSVSCLLFVVLISTSFFSFYVVEAFCKGMGLLRFGKRVLWTALIIDFLSIQDFVLHEYFKWPRGWLTSLVIVEMVMVSKFNMPMFAANFLDKGFPEAVHHSHHEHVV